MTPEREQAIELCRLEQLRCAEEIPAHPDQRGVRLGLHDWFAEEFLIEQGGAQ